MFEVSENISLVTLRNLPNQIQLIAKVFCAVADADVNVDMITQTQAHKNKVICPLRWKTATWYPPSAP